MQTTLNFQMKSKKLVACHRNSKLTIKNTFKVRQNRSLKEIIGSIQVKFKLKTKTRIVIS